MSSPRSERETTIGWTEEQKVVRIWSSSPATWRYMYRLGVAPTQHFALHRVYELPLERFRFGLKGKPRGAKPPRRGRGAA